MRLFFVACLSVVFSLFAGCSCSTTGSMGNPDTGFPHDAPHTDAPVDVGAMHDMGTVHDDTGTDAGHDAAVVDPCGGCPTGFTCGPSAYCVSSTGIPAFAHVFLIVMENHSLSSIQGNADAPFINGLMTDWSYASHYVTRISGPIHPSLPNYITLTSGSPQGVGCDCSPTANASTSAHLSCNSSLMDSSCPLDVTDHLGNSLDAAGVEWREYGEDMGSPCNVTDSGDYVARHIPLLYFNDVQTNAARCNNRIRDYADFAGDLGSGTYRFSMISPNLCNDMHGNSPIFDTCGGVSAENNGDNWLTAVVPTILATPGFATDGTDVLFIVWDEEDGSTGSEPIPLIIVSPLVNAGHPTATSYEHVSLLATITDGLGAARVGGASGPIDDIWR